MSYTAHKKLVARGLLIAGVLSLVVGLYYARAQEPGVTYARGYSYKTFDLKVDSEASYNGEVWEDGTWALKNLKPWKDRFWNFKDVKPGDSGENTVSLHVNKDAWVCLEFVNLKSHENGINEPESHEPVNDFAEGMNFFAWRDDGDNIFEVGEVVIFGPASAREALDNQVYPVADYTHGPAIPAGNTKYFGVYWCAGELLVDVPSATISCNGEALGNEAQTDSLEVDLQLVALPKKDKPRFKCSDIYLPPPGEQCELGTITITNSNTSTVVSTTTSSSNTGGNSANGGTVITGNATSTATTTNIVNSDDTSIADLFKNLFNR